MDDLVCSVYIHVKITYVNLVRKWRNGKKEKYHTIKKTLVLNILHGDEILFAADVV